MNPSINHEFYHWELLSAKLALLALIATDKNNSKCYTCLMAFAYACKEKGEETL
jgi:hypothetical protein